MPKTCYRVNDAQIVAELFDNEAIIMNLSDGVYFTLSDTAAEVWTLIESNCDIDAMTTHLSNRHNVDAAQCRADVSELIGILLEESIVLENLSDEAPTALSDIADFGAYAKPELTRHTDMAEVMAMDPPLPELGAAGKSDS